MLVTFVPYDLEKDVGRAYERCMSRLTKTDVGCFLDHDAAFTTERWQAQLAEAIESHPRAGLFTAMTNRIGCGYQRAQNVQRDNHDMEYHCTVGASLARRHAGAAVDVTDRSPVSGVLLALRQTTWERLRPIPQGLLGVDNALHAAVRSLGERVMLLPGLYVYHWYRGDGTKEHLRSARNVPLPRPWWTA